MSGTSTMTPGDQPKIKIKIRTDFFREKYDKLVDIKRRFDPEYVFTASGLGIDASNAPVSKCMKLYEN